MLYFHPDAIPEGHQPEFRIHRPTYRDAAGKLQHGECLTAADTLEEALSSAKAENQFREGHYVTDTEWNVYHP